MSTFAGSNSMRVNYEQGVDSYYSSTGSDYRNPHLDGIIKATACLMDVWWCACAAGGSRASPGGGGPAAAASATLGTGAPVVRVLDLACGSGEATLAVELWWRGGTARARGPRAAERRQQQQAQQQQAQQQQAQQQQAQQRQAQQQQVQQVQPQCQLEQGRQEGRQPAACKQAPYACQPGQFTQSTAASFSAEEASSSHVASPPPDNGGNGNSGTGDTSREAQGADAADQPEPTQTHDHDNAPSSRPSHTLVPSTAPPPVPPRPPLHVDACDPYTAKAYEKWTGRPAEAFSFQDVADGRLAEREYHLVICSYALHLLDDSKLFSTLLQLSLMTTHLMVLSPHKKPHIGPHTGWHLLHHSVVERVHAWLYESTNV